MKEGKIEVGVAGEIEAQLEAIDPELNLENLHTNPAKANQIREFLKASVNSFILKTLQENSENLSLRSEYISLIVDALIGHILNSDENAGNILIFAALNFSIERNIKLVKAPLDYSEDARFEAMAVFLPNINDFGLFNLVELKGIKPKPGAKKDAGTVEELPKPGEGEEKIVVAAEVDFDDEAHVFPVTSEELRVLAHHRVASNLLRREILLFLTSLFKELDMKEIEVLKRVNAKAEKAETVIAGSFSKNLTVLIFDRS